VNNGKQRTALERATFLNLIELVASVVRRQFTGTPVVSILLVGALSGYGSFGNQSAEYWTPALNIGTLTACLIPTQDSIQEFRVQTQSGRNGKFSGGVTNLSTKSDEFTARRGYEYVRNKIFQCNDFFSTLSEIQAPWCKTSRETPASLNISTTEAVTRRFGFSAGKASDCDGQPFTPQFPTRKKDWRFSKYASRISLAYLERSPTDARKSLSSIRL